MSVFYPILTVVVRKTPNSRRGGPTCYQGPAPFLPGLGSVPTSGAPPIMSIPIGRYLGSGMECAQSAARMPSGALSGPTTSRCVNSYSRSAAGLDCPNYPTTRAENCKT
jgi:hypothetical protein